MQKIWSFVIRKMELQPIRRYMKIKAVPKNDLTSIMTGKT